MNSTVHVSAHEAPIRGTRMRWLSSELGEAPVLYVHGVPDDGSMWLPFLQRTGGIPPDLPGFAASAKPRHHPFGIASIADQLEGPLDHLQVDSFRLVVHDWGGAALALAQRIPDRLLQRLVIIDALPLLPGYHWHRLARIWRTPLVGELFMALAAKGALRFLSREASVAKGPMPEAFIDRVWAHFDRDTRRAILRLYRSAPEQMVESSGDRLTHIHAPTLVVWGEHDPYVPTGAPTPTAGAPERDRAARARCLALVLDRPARPD